MEFNTTGVSHGNPLAGTLQQSTIRRPAPLMPGIHAWRIMLGARKDDAEGT
jgi:hypothetical protein